MNTGNGDEIKKKKKSISKNKVNPRYANKADSIGMSSNSSGVVPSVSRIAMEKHVNMQTSAYFVLPAGGMHFAVPDLNFKGDHFEEKSTNVSLFKKDQSVLQKQQSHTAGCKANGAVKPSRKDKLPLAVSLTAGYGQSMLKKDGTESGKMKSSLPSDTLLASAAFLKSYFSFSQDKNQDMAEKPDMDKDDDTVKTKMLGLWHSVKYGWSANMKTNFSRETPICLLGKMYHKAFRDDRAFEGTGYVYSNVEGFKQDFVTLPWFTYRRKFPPLPESSLTTDCGWGCMIRSGQMMMATALTRHFLPVGWRYNSTDDSPQSSIHRQIMKWFCDAPSKQCPFSLHSLLLAGYKMNKKAGSWYGPSCVAHMFKETLSAASKEISTLDRIIIYVAQDGAIYTQDILETCSAGKCICTKSNAQTNVANNPSLNISTRKRTISSVSFNTDDFCEVQGSGSSSGEPFVFPNCDKNRSSWCEVNMDSSMSSYCHIDHYSFEEKAFPLDLFVDSNRELYRRRECSFPTRTEDGKEDTVCDFCQGWKSCLILIPVRLGGSSINPIYYSVISSLLLHDLSVGIIGGRPKHSLYFVGFQDDSLIHLDPHFSQDAVSFDDPDFSLSSFHCTSPKKISVSRMDPSATLGFYCHTRSQFYRLKEEASQIATARDGGLDSPIFEFVDGRCADMNGWLGRTLSEEESSESDIPVTPPHSMEDSEILTID